MYIFFQIVVFCTGTVIVSFFVTKKKCINYAHSELDPIIPANQTNGTDVKEPCAWFTGLNTTTFSNNLDGKCYII